MAQQEKVSPAWRKQYAREAQWDGDFDYAAGSNKKYNFGKGKSGDSLKGGISNPKNWRGGKWEMEHDPHDDRKKLEAKDKKKISTQDSKPATKATNSKKVTKKVITTKR